MGCSAYALSLGRCRKGTLYKTVTTMEPRPGKETERDTKV